jgi:phosphoglycolate phosphatase-like HAD superfamily hydrolase
VGIRVGVATSHGEITEACLVNTKLYSLVDCLVTQEDVKRPKPHPDSILLALALLTGCAADAVAGQAALFVGDTSTDIEAGRAAAVRTVGVTYGVSQEAEIRAARPDHVLHAFHQMRQFVTGAERRVREAHAGEDAASAFAERDRRGPGVLNR